MFLAGCSVGPKIGERPVQYNPKYSYAKNILNASGMAAVPIQKMEDVVITQKQYDAMKFETTALAGAKDGAVIGGTVVALDMYNAVGFVDAGSILSSADFQSFVGLGLLKGLVEPAHPMLSSHLAIWMPKEMASTEDEMKQKLVNIFEQAHKKSVPEGFVYEESPLIENGKKNYTRFSANGGICDKAFSKSRKTCAGSLNGVVHTQEFMLDNKYQPGFRPAFFENPGEEAWVAYVRQSLSLNGITCYLSSFAEVTEEDRMACNKYNQAYLVNLKKNLPSWIYIYEFDHAKKSEKSNKPTQGWSFL